MSPKIQLNDVRTDHRKRRPPSGSNYDREKHEFLKWVKQKAQERGYNPTIDFGANILYENEDIVIRTRATHYQHPPYKFKVNDEVLADVSQFDQAYSVLLVLRAGNEFDPATDDFYPLSLSFYRRAANRDKNGDYPISINPSNRGVRVHKNSLDRMFPPGGDFKSGTDGATKTDQHVDQEASEKVQRLNEIYQDVCDTSAED